MPDISRTWLQGFILQATEISHGSVIAGGYTEADPLVDIPAGGAESDLVLRAHGIASSSSDHDVTLQRGGFPGRSSQHAGFRWKSDGEAVYRGWDPPHVRDWQPIYIAANGSGTAYAHPHALGIRRPSAYHGPGRMFVAVSRKVGTLYTIQGFYRDEVTGAWSAPIEIGDDGIQTGHNYPTTIELESGHLVCYYWIPGAGGDTQVRARYSVNGGLTWATYSDFVLPYPVPGTPGKLRAAAGVGEVILIGTCGTFFQFASGNDGQSFGLIVEGEFLLYRFGVEVVPSLDAGFLVTFIELNGSDFNTFAQPLGSAFQPISSVVASKVFAEISSFDLTPDIDGETTVWIDDDGTAWIVSSYQENAGADRFILIAKSEDWGATWIGPFGVEQPADISRQFWRKQDEGNLRLIEFSGCMLGGRAALVCRWLNGGYDQDSFGVLYLGGYTTKTLRTTAPADIAAEWPADQWFGVMSPNSLPFWTTVQTGAPTVAPTTAGLSVLASAVEGLEWSRALGADIQTLRVDRTLKATGPDFTSRAIYVRAGLSDGVATEYQVEVWIAAGDVLARDVIAGTTLAILSADALSTLLAVRIEINASGKAWIGFRVETSPGDAIRDWTVLYSGTVAKKSVGVAAGGTVGWGIAPGQGGIVVWAMATHTPSTTLFPLPSVAADLLPRSITNYPVELRDGYAISAVDGPGVRLAAWSCGHRARYGLDRMDPRRYPSPRHGWRSTNAPGVQRIEWSVNGSGEATELLRRSLGVYLDGLNWRTGRIQIHNPTSGTWSTILEIDTAIGATGLDAVRVGNKLRPAAGTPSADRYMNHADLIGSFVTWDAVICTVTANSSGKWEDGTGLPPTLELGGSDAGDLTGTPTTGTIDICAPRWVGVAFNVAAFDQIALEIDDQATMEGDRRIGVCMIGPLIVVPSPEWGRSMEVDADRTIVTEREDGTRSAVVRGPTRREFSILWPAGVDAGQVQGSPAADLDYYKDSGGRGVGARSELPYLLAGVFEESSGPFRLMTWLPKIPRASGGWTARALSCYGRIVGTVDREVFAGDEDESEAIRVSQMTFSEEK